MNLFQNAHLPCVLHDAGGRTPGGDRLFGPPRRLEQTRPPPLGPGAKQVSYSRGASVLFFVKCLYNPSLLLLLF